MYYVAKAIQATGLGIVLIGFIRNFPNLIDMKVLLAGILIFTAGWAAQAFLLKR